MKSKERVLRSIRHKEVDRVPSYLLSDYITNYALAKRLNMDSMDWMTDSFYTHVGHLEMVERLGCDIVFLWPNIITPAGCKYFSCGSVHAALHEGTVIIEKMPLEEISGIDEILKYKWPSPDWSDYKIPSWIVPTLKDKDVCAYVMNILLLYAMGMRGMENLMMDMASDLDMEHAVLKKVSEHHCERIRRFLTVNEGLIDIVGVGDDVAGQAGMFFSVDMWRKYIKPYLQKAVDLCLEFKVIPYFHGCGEFSVLYKDFIEMGIACTGRLQTEAKGNIFASIKKEFGKDLCLWGAVDCQHKVIDGTTGDVYGHIRELLRENYDGTGFVAGPSHSFTEDTPIENILAVYDVLRCDSRI